MSVNTTYDTVDLLGIIPSTKTPARFFRDMFFAINIFRFSTRKIALDRIIEDQRVAPYVSPVIAGRVRKERGFSTLFYEAPYVKEKSEIKIEDAMDRGPGEALGGDKDPATRYDDAITDLTAKHEERITRREELQAIELLRTGKITVVGDGYDINVIDFLRDAGQTITLAGVARWTQPTTRDPLANLQTWSLQTQRLPFGGPIRTWVFDPVAASNFLAALKERDELKLLDRTYRGPNASFVLGPQAEQSYYLGNVNGMDFWVNQDQVELTDGGALTNVLPDNTVIGVSDAAGGALAYGAVRVAGVLQPLDRYPRIVGGPNMDPSSEHLVTECSPLCMLRRVNATLCATVG
ncbi:MAG TPA: major capsid protein [Gemmatimonadaceae bacterium]|nr:major capsid protein [Gemmatimonadaceae bacterium]